MECEGDPPDRTLPERADALICLLDALTSERDRRRVISLEINSEHQAGEVASRAAVDEVLIRGSHALVPGFGGNGRPAYGLLRVRDLDVEEHGYKQSRAIDAILSRDPGRRSFDRRVNTEAGRLVNIPPTLISSIEAKLETGLLAPRKALAELAEAEAGVVLRWALVGLQAARDSLSAHLD